MAAISALSRNPSFRVWLVVLLILFLTLCGVHIVGIHHDSQSAGIELAAAIASIVASVLSVFAARSQLKDKRVERSMPWETAWVLYDTRCLRPISAPLRI